MQKKVLLFLCAILCLSNLSLQAQDSDGDTVDDYLDLDDDNDGILDIYECEVPIADFSFENTAPYGLNPNWNRNDPFIEGNAGSHEIDPPSNYPNAPEGVQFLYINTDGPTGINGVTLNVPLAVYEPTNYQFHIDVGDGIQDGFYRNDGNSTIQLGYGDNAAGFTPIVGAEINVLPTDTPGGVWTSFDLNFTVAPGDPAVGEGVLIRIIHERVGTGGAGNYDNIRLSKDTDGDGDNDCIDLDSDGDGCFDVVEAGHTDAGGGVLGTVVDADGLVTTGVGYTGSTQAVLDGTLNVCDPNYMDFDGDGIQDDVDLDDDNDGIRDSYECEIPLANAGFENYNSFGTGYLDHWVFQPATGGSSSGQSTPDPTSYNSAAEGAAYAFINFDGSVVSTENYGSFEVGGYTLQISLGDGFAYNDGYRNDGTSIIEIGYHDGDYNNFTPVVNRTIQAWETPNGMWTQFSLTALIAAGNPALGQAIAIRITHQSNGPLLQWQGNYDDIRIYRDTDGDGFSDCMQLDSDGDGCNDVVEAGHTDAGGGVLGASVDGNGMVNTGGGYTGPRSEQWDASLDSACNPIDTDLDGIEDGDYFRYDAGNTLQTNIDEDNDNDGITDEDEDCNLLDSGFLRQPFNFELPENDYLLGGNNSPFTTVMDYWYDVSGTGESYAMLVNAETYTYEDPVGSGNFVTVRPNYITDGTLLPDLPGLDYQNDAYLALNGDVTITQTGSRLVLEEGSFIVTIAVGDALDYMDPYRNDGTSVIEIGYDTDLSEGGVNYNALPHGITIDPEDTPNGTWTDFSFNYEILPGSPAIGQHLSIRITHTGNAALNQLSGNYDHIRIQRDTDGDGTPDCQDFDSDDDGCPDSIEAGYVDDDRDGILGTGTPTVNAQGRVTSETGYNLPFNLNVRIPATPPTIDAPLDDETVCSGADAVFTITTTAGTGTIVYEWAESTDGVIWTVLTDDVTYSGTTTNELTVMGTTIAMNGNLYRVRVSADDYLCFEEDIATLTVNEAPSIVTLAAVTANICSGEDAEFTLTGDAGDIVTYSFDGTTAEPPITLDATGNGTIVQPSATANVTVTLLSVEDATSTCVQTTALPTATVAVHPEPSINTATASCAPDLLTYDVTNITFNAGTIVGVNAGTLTGNSVTGIPSGVDLVITVDNNDCIRDLTITAPDCSCPTIAQPINPVEAAICEGGTNPVITVELDPSGLGDQVDWYDSPTGGTLLQGNSLAYTPIVTAPGVHTYYAEAVQDVSDCTSSVRTPVQFTIHPQVTADVLPPQEECDSFTLPALSSGNNYFTGTGGTGTALFAGDQITASQTIYIYAQSGTMPNCTDESSFMVTIHESPTIVVDDVECSADLQTYNVTIQTVTGILTADFGTVVGNSTVTDIPVDENVTLTVDNNGCTDNLTVTAPICPCPVLEAPVNPQAAGICVGEPTPALGVDLPTSGGDTILWFDVSIGGSPLSTGPTYLPTVTQPGNYIFYAETQDSVNGCSSDERTPVTLVISAIPVADTSNDVEGCESYILPALSANNRYFTESNGAGTELFAGNAITQDQTIYIRAESPDNPNCNNESSFSVSILNEPTISLPETVSLCVGASGASQTIQLGMDLGPGYRYDWTPDNDTNNDGIEEPIFYVSTPGSYSLRVFEVGTTTECGGGTTYTTQVIESLQPLSVEVELTVEGYELNASNRVRAIVNNDNFLYDQFEYSLDDPNGPYQTDNFFQNVPGGIHRIYVRGLGNCGSTISSEPFLIVNHPTVFTPNGDGTNETWNILGTDDPNWTGDVSISIFDRHGKLMAQVDPLGPGWDGTYNSRPVPSTDYWFIVDYTDLNTNERISFNGHFSLIR